MSISDATPIAILYEHPTWFSPLFTALERREVPHLRWEVTDRTFEVPGGADRDVGLLFNRMSPSAHTRGHGPAINWTLQYLDRLARRGVPVVNGHAAFLTEISKARQLAILDQLGLPAPRSRVIHRPAQAPSAADGLRFPVIVKPNVGGSGAGIRRFDDRVELREAAEDGEIDLGFDGVALVQELVPTAESRIVRVEVLGGRLLYAIRIHLPEGADDAAAADGDPGGAFNLCPASICSTVEGDALERSAYPEGTPEKELRVEAYEPPSEIVDAVQRLTAAAGVDVGGVEYLVDERTGDPVFYDINALSNFVADAPAVVGFDPFDRLVDYLVEAGGGLTDATDGPIGGDGATAAGRPGERREAS